tara:strand:+ start:1486 stop:3264 length:1779 start_codon:yes stop_codon:yes gene_type:complete
MYKIRNPFFIVFSIFLIFLFFAFNSILSAYYVFHDDWALYLFEKNNIFDAIKNHRYKNAHTEMGRPLGHAFFTIGHFLVDKINDANYVRFISLTLMSFFGALLFRLLSVLNYSKIFSLIFISLFLITPPFYIMSYQISGQYISFCLIMTTIFMLISENYFIQSNTYLKSKKGFVTICIFLLFLLAIGSVVNVKFFIIGFIFYVCLYMILWALSKKDLIKQRDILSFVILSLLFFFSLCMYAHAALLAIAFPLFVIFSPLSNDDIYKNGMALKYLIIILGTIFLYFLTLKTFIWYENINTLIDGRRIQIDFNLIGKAIFYFKDVLPHAFSLWRIDAIYSLNTYIILLLSIFGSFLFFLKKNSLYKSLMNTLLIIFVLFLTIAPVILIKDNYFTPYRSMIGHTFILYFLPVYLIFQVFSKYKIGNFIFIIILSSYIALYGQWPNKIIDDYVISPTEQEISFIQKQLEINKISEKIQSGEKIKIYFNRLHDHSMHGNLIQNMVVLAATGRNMPWIPEVFHALIYDKFNLKYSLQRRDINEKISYIKKNDEKIQIISVSFPWGDLIYSNNIISVVDKEELDSSIFINMNDIKLNSK